MPFIDYNNVSVSSIACAVPSFVQKIRTDGDDGAAAYRKSFVKSTGVLQRHISAIGQTGTDLCAAAAKAALRRADRDIGDVDAVVAVVEVSDYVAPGNACLLQYILGMREDSAAFDVNLGCSGFPYGMFIGAAMLQNDNMNRVLITGALTENQKYRPPGQFPSDETFLFGEAGSAVLLEKKEGSPLGIGLWTDGSGYKYLFAPFGGARNPVRAPGEAILPNGEILGANVQSYMDGVEIFNFSITKGAEAIRSFLERNGKNLRDFDGLVLHQANLKIIKAMAKLLRADADKTPVSVDRYANTSPASVPLTILDAYAGCEKKTLCLLTAGFGIGLSWGVASFQLDTSGLTPIFETDELFEEGIMRYR
jgi:3-oxoacyl-[acyl-carrier-protein] synthase-3